MEGVIIRVACLNVKRIEHQGEQKSCLKTSSHCKKNKINKIKKSSFLCSVRMYKSVNSMKTCVQQ